MYVLVGNINKNGAENLQYEKPIIVLIERAKIKNTQNETYYIDYPNCGTYPGTFPTSLSWLTWLGTKSNAETSWIKVLNFSLMFIRTQAGYK